ncbi:ParB/RepB/Spo0J family partition protein [Yunchengibacter salinarum]|uniref:ParB/RepB/Spo0J family partition protein n=1 Tax=Yunchengibacter salinarum TaxID=3133399 RepID=UPI0035B69487
MATKRKKGLGRGLSALMVDDRETGDTTAPDQDALAAEGLHPRQLPIGLLERNPHQPRQSFDAEALEDLARSIKEKGLLQPVLVRPLDGGRYQIVAGERRWRAAQKAAVHDVPVVVQELDDADVLQIGIIENIQRQNLTPMEEASAYQRLIDDFGHNQADVAQVVGKSRSHVANLLRLLGLPESVRALVDQGALSMGHARALIGATDPDALAKKVVADGLSVRQTEKLAGEAKGSPVRRREPRPGGQAAKDADTVALEKDIAAATGVRVNIRHGDDGGTLTLGYDTLDQLDALCAKLGVCGI